MSLTVAYASSSSVREREEGAVGPPRQAPSSMAGQPAPAFIRRARHAMPYALLKHLEALGRGLSVRRVEHGQLPVGPPRKRLQPLCRESVEVKNTTARLSAFYAPISPLLAPSSSQVRDAA